MRQKSFGVLLLEAERHNDRLVSALRTLLRDPAERAQAKMALAAPITPLFSNCNSQHNEEAP